jgi:hypothetical protein
MSGNSQLMSGFAAIACQALVARWRQPVRLPENSSQVIYFHTFPKSTPDAEDRRRRDFPSAHPESDSAKQSLRSP